MASSPAQIPPGGTFFDTVKKSFKDVPIDAANDNAISTDEFCDAAESLVTLFGTFCFSSARRMGDVNWICGSGSSLDSLRRYYPFDI